MLNISGRMMLSMTIDKMVTLQRAVFQLYSGREQVQQYSIYKYYIEMRKVYFVHHISGGLVVLWCRGS
jgi:hypothetical protein